MKAAETCYAPVVAPTGNPENKYLGWYRPSVKFNDIAQAVVQATGVHPVDFYDGGRLRKNVNARMIFAYLCRKDANQTYHGIGKHLRKNHATIIYYVGCVADIITYDRVFREQVQEARRLLYHRNNG